MGIKSNPHGVGYSGEDRWRVADVRCVCCRIPFRLRHNVDDDLSTVRCPTCAEHQPGPQDSGDDRANRAEVHVEMYRRLAEGVGRNAAQSKREVLDSKEQVRAALESRNGYRQILVDVARLHVPEDEGCSCGLERCKTWSVINDAGGRGHDVLSRAEEEARWSVFSALAQEQSQAARLAGQ